MVDCLFYTILVYCYSLFQKKRKMISMIDFSWGLGSRSCDPGSRRTWPRELEIIYKKPHPKMSNGFQSIFKSLRACCILVFVGKFNYFTKTEIRHTLRLLKIGWKPLDFFGWGFLWMISNSLGHVPLDPGSHELDPGPQEKSLKSFCVSFGKDCSFEMVAYAVVNFLKDSIVHTVTD